MNKTAHRPIYEIAQDIRKDWRKDGKPNIYFGAVPYLEAMDSLNRITDTFGAEDATSIIAYFLGNATAWRGEKAKAIKAELKAMIK